MPNEDESFFSFDHVHIVWDEQITLHQQKTWELSYVIKGSGVRAIGDVMEPFSQAEVILIPPDLPHCWSFDKSDTDAEGKIENITVVFSDLLLRNIPSVFPELADIVSEIMKNTNAVSFSGSTLKQLQEILVSMISETKVERLTSLIKLLELVASPGNTNMVGRPVVEDRNRRRLQQVYWYVMNHYQRDITLNEISGIVNMERSSFCVFFKRMTNKPFFTFLTEYRVESSCQMLLKTSKTVAEICFASGFRDVPYFNRVFKKQKSLTPKQYREQVINV